VEAHFVDGSSARGDVLIGADGLRSTVRAHVLPDAKPIYAGYAAWRGLAPEAEFSPALHRDLFTTMAFCLPPGDQILGYPVAGPDNDLRLGHRRYNVVWYRPADEQVLHRLLTDKAGNTHSMSIPPPLISRDVIDDMRADAESTLAPQFRDVLRLVAQPFLQPIYDIDVPRMALRRIAIIGDAAFVARPHVGAGVAKAAQDALALANALAAIADVETALRRFETGQIALGRRIVARGRQLGACLQAHRTSAEETAMAAKFRAPETVLEETAALDFLAAFEAA
jgi:2-polyprenyl-6-methoxyphenol hydroxylase-like FAD-dependent oxidoreductase